MADAQGAPAASRTGAVELLRVVVPAVLGVASLALYGGLAVALLVVKIPPDNKDIVAGVMNLIGGSLVGCAFGYFFGSSATSAHAAAAVPAPPLAPTRSGVPPESPPPPALGAEARMGRPG